MNRRVQRKIEQKKRRLVRRVMRETGIPEREAKTVAAEIWKTVRGNAFV